MRYDFRNDTIIEGLHPALRHKALQALDELEYVGEDALLTSGFRTLDEQADLWAQGRTKAGIIVTNAQPGWSFHNYGLAFDLVPIGPLGVELSKRNRLEWAGIPRYNTYGRMLQSIGFQWGFALWGYDRPHFQYCTTAWGENLTIEQVRAGNFPEVERARLERRAALEDRIVMAQRALGKRWLRHDRRRALERFVEEKSHKVAYI